jgi:APA family basic amino acid/polyamine antiporter
VAGKAAEVYFGAAGARAIAAVILLTQLGSISAFILGGSRVAYAMAEDGLAWRGLAQLSGDTPRRAVALQGAAAAVLCAVFHFRDLLFFASAVLQAASALACASLLVLRRKVPPAERSWRAPLGAFFPLLYIAGSACILAAAGKYLDELAPEGERTGAVVVALSIAAAVPLYFLLPARRGRSREGGAQSPRKKS